MKTPPKRSAQLGERKLEGAPPTQRVGGIKFFGRAAAEPRRARIYRDFLENVQRRLAFF